MIDKIYEHLKTKKKYNTLELKYKVKCDELDRKTIEVDTLRRIKLKQINVLEEHIKELVEENTEQKSQITILRKENRELRKGLKEKDVKKNAKRTTRGRQKSK